MKATIRCIVFSVSILVFLVILTGGLAIAQSLEDTKEPGMVSSQIERIRESIREKGFDWEARDYKREFYIGTIIVEDEVDDFKLPADLKPLSSSLDWRDNSGNYVSPVKDQGNCGSCWAFAAVAALESLISIYESSPGEFLDLSEQILVSCSTGNFGCNGGYMNVTAQFMREEGTDEESCFPYTATNNLCSNACSGWRDQAYQINSYSSVSRTVEALKTALQSGPLPVAYYVYRDFFYYGSGVYEYAWGSLEGGHAVLLVGYQDTPGQYGGGYFIVKNSWGPHWGESGYFRIGYSQVGGTVGFGRNSYLYTYSSQPPSPITLCEALDNCDLEWTTGGNGEWFGQAQVSYDGVDAAQSGSITHSQSTWLETAVIGPGQLSFWWKVSSESSFDYLEFYIDGVRQDRISGEVDWQQKSYSISPGQHTLRWRYMKDGSVDRGSDCGWVDQVVWTGGAAPTPTPPVPTGTMRVEDSIPPIDDHRMPFGELFLGASRTERITVANTDPAYDLVVSGIGLTGGYQAGSLSAGDTGKDIPETGDRKGRTKFPIEAEHRPDQLLVAFRPGIQASGRESVHAEMGAVRVHGYRRIPVEVVELPEGSDLAGYITAYEARPEVAYAEPNYEWSLIAQPNDPRFGELWGLRNTGQTGGTAGADISAPEAWDITTGSSRVIVAVIDTGIDYNHPDLAGNMWVNPNPGFGDIHGARWTGGNGTVTSGNPMDGHGHGTHCAGTIGAVGNNNIGVTGVSWDVRLMALKFLSDSGPGSTADAISAVEYAIDKGAQLTSNSWGGGGYSQALKDMIDAAGAANQLFVAAAGNSASNNDVSPHYPSSYDCANIIAVASSDHNDQRSLFSCYGRTSVDLAAPGTSILSTWTGGGYNTISGTSMATPHVAGVAALILSLNPGAPHQEVKGWILEGADVLPAWTGRTVTEGRLNAAASLALANPHFQLANLPSLPATLGPGQSFDFDVIYQPASEGEHGSLVRIVSNDASAPEVEVELSGSAIEVQPSPTPTTSPTSTPTPSVTPTPTPTPVPTVPPTPIPTVPPTPEPTLPPTPEPTVPPTPEPTVPPTPEPTVTPTPSIPPGTSTPTPTAHTPTPTATIVKCFKMAGQVIERDTGSPIPGAEVRAVCPDRKGTVAAADGGGAYEVEICTHFQDGTVRVQARYPGYIPGYAEAAYVNWAGEGVVEMGDIELNLDSISFPGIVSGDYTGDGLSELAIFRPATGLWTIRGVSRLYYGRGGDILVPADYTGDGTVAPAVFRPVTGLWAVRNLTRIYFGGFEDVPVPGDYSGTGTAAVGIFRPASGLWAIRRITRAYFGSRYDQPVMGDYSGDGWLDLAVFRSSSGLWAIRDVSRLYYGAAGDRLVPGAYDGFRYRSAGIFRPATRLWAIRGVTRAYFGRSGDLPVPADYQGIGVDEIGIFRKTSGLWAIRGVTRAYFGSGSDVPVTR